VLRANSAKNRAQQRVTKPFLVFFEAKIVRNMNHSRYACATLKESSFVLLHPKILLNIMLYIIL